MKLKLTGNYRADRGFWRGSSWAFLCHWDTVGILDGEQKGHGGCERVLGRPMVGRGNENRALKARDNCFLFFVFSVCRSCPFSMGHGCPFWFLIWDSSCLPLPRDRCPLSSWHLPSRPLPLRILALAWTRKLKMTAFIDGCYVKNAVAFHRYGSFLVGSAKVDFIHRGYDIGNRRDVSAGQS